MNIRCVKKLVTSSDGKHKLNGVMYIPEGNIKGLFQIVHGMTEYIGRYDEFMQKLAENGYVAFGFDLLGHGLTVNVENEYGFFASEGGWKYLADDVEIFGRAVREEFDGTLPLILMGFSMGSFIVRIAAEKFNSHDKLILMGTAGPHRHIDKGRFILDCLKKAKGEDHVSDMIDKLFFGSYNKKFGNGDDHNWLTSDPDELRKYNTDPLCRFRFTVSAMGDLARLCKECNTERWFSSCVTSKPILIISGKDDPVGDYGAGLLKIHDNLYRNGGDVKLVVYDGFRHDILHDRCREKVTSDILAFAGK